MDGAGVGVGQVVSDVVDRHFDGHASPMRTRSAGVVGADAGNGAEVTVEDAEVVAVPPGEHPVADAEPPVVDERDERAELPGRLRARWWARRLRSAGVGAADGAHHDVGAGLAVGPSQSVTISVAQRVAVVSRR